VKFLRGLLILFVGLSAQAVEVSFYTEFSKQNVYQDVTKVICNTSEGNLCNYMCGNISECIRPELKCTNCAGTSDQFLRLIFTKSTQNFRVSNLSAWPTGNLVSYLADNYYVIVSYKSIYNFHKMWGSEEIAKSFKSFCPQEEVDPLFIVALNDNDQPSQLKAVICHNIEGQSYALSIESKIESKTDLKTEAKIINQP